MIMHCPNSNSASAFLLQAIVTSTSWEFSGFLRCRSASTNSYLSNQPRLTHRFLPHYRLRPIWIGISSFLIPGTSAPSCLQTRSPQSGDPATKPPRSRFRTHFLPSHSQPPRSTPISPFSIYLPIPIVSQTILSPRVGLLLLVCEPTERKREKLPKVVELPAQNLLVARCPWVQTF